MLKKVYICFPSTDNLKDNFRKASRYSRYALLCNTAPIIPQHYSFSLDDHIQREREIGIAAGLSLLWFCDEMWVFGDKEKMKRSREINFCENVGIKIVYISKALVKKKIGGINKWKRKFSELSHALHSSQ